MKPEATSAFITFIQTHQYFPFADLYTFTLSDGTQDFFTSLDVDVVLTTSVASRTVYTIYKSNALRIEGLKYKLAVGWQVDEQDIKISAYPAETLGGSAFFGAIEEGLLDGAYLKRQRAFWAPTDGRVFLDVAAPPVGIITLFTGRVSTIAKLGRTAVELKLKSPMVLLDIDMPRNTYEPGCQWSLFDAGCTLSRASFSTSYVVSAANALNVEPVGGISLVTGADGVPYYAFGRLHFTSGVNNGLIVSVGSNDGVVFQLKFPLNNVPVPGDTFTASAGCAKTGRSGACDLKFNNLPNFRGFPLTPPISMSV